MAPEQRGSNVNDRDLRKQSERSPAGTDRLAAEGFFLDEERRIT